VARTADASLAALLNRFENQEHRYSVDPTYLHVSDLFGACFRQLYFIAKEGKKFEKSIPPKTMTLFRMGRAFEAAVKDNLRDLGVIKLEPEVLRDEQLRIVASPDTRLLNGQIIEVKAKNPYIFKITKRMPLPQDQYQLEQYLWIDKTNRGKLLSVTWGERVSYHEHIVHYNVKSVEITKRKVGELREAEAGGPLPGRICKSPLDGRAVTCPVRESCFGIPGELTKTIGEVVGHE